jgi:hypothetical protein
MSDRLALAHAFEDSGMPREKAEHVATTVYDAIRGEVVRKADLLELEQRIGVRIGRVEKSLAVMRWQVGGLYAILVPVVWLLVRVAAKVGALPG